MSLITISSFSKDRPSPSARSARPPKSAKDNNLTKPGASLILKFSIINFELDSLNSIMDEYIKIPPFNPLKKEYSVNNGFGKSEYISKYFFYYFFCHF